MQKVSEEESAKAQFKPAEKHKNSMRSPLNGDSQSNHAYLEEVLPSSPCLSDVTEVKLETDIAKALKIPFLSEAISTVSKWPVQGIFWGPRCRAMANMIVTTNSKNINVFFIVDKGSPIVAISSRTCNELKIRDTSKISSLKINDEPSNAQLSTEKHRECNVLGAEYFDPIVETVLNYRTKQVLLRKVENNIPKAEDEFRLNDVDEHIMETEISEKLRIEYLSSADDVTEFPKRIEGVIWSQRRRPIANLIVEFNGKNGRKKVNAFFLIDTGAPHTYITDKTMERLGFDTLKLSFPLKINNINCDVRRSVRHFKERNVLGTDYFDKEVELTYTYHNKKVILNFI